MKKPFYKNIFSTVMVGAFLLTTISCGESKNSSENKKSEYSNTDAYKEGYAVGLKEKSKGRTWGCNSGNAKEYGWDNQTGIDAFCEGFDAALYNK